MANSIKVKRSATPSAAPTTANLELGELAINTYDGRLYIKKDNGTASIVEVGTGSTAYTEYNFTATASQTTFAVGVSMILVNVFLNGIRLLPTTDYAISGTNIILTTGAGVGDIIVVLVYFNSAVGGTVTSVSVVTANGVSGTVATATTTPAITLSLTKTGTGTTYVVDTSPTLVTPLLGTPTSGVLTNCTGTASGLTAGNVTTNANLTGGVTSVGNAATVVTNANLTGMVTSVGNAASLGSFTSAQLATALTDETGSGANVFATSPTITTPIIVQSINAQTSAAYVTVAADAGAIVTVSNASANTFKLPTNASVAYAIGSTITLIQIGAGATTISAVTPGTTTVLSTGATAASPVLAQYKSATCIKTGTDAWYVVGAIA